MSLEGRLMGHQGYSKEFKAEVVRQVIERGYPVCDVAARVGASEESDYPSTESWELQVPASESPRGQSSSCGQAPAQEPARIINKSAR
jgi:transposase-like protein